MKGGWSGRAWERQVEGVYARWTENEGCAMSTEVC